MATFKNQIVVTKPLAEVYDFLADLNNHEKLMPPEVKDWQSSRDQASFSIPSVPGLSLKVEDRAENQHIRIIPAQKAPFDISLTWHTEAIDEEVAGDQEETRVWLVIEAELNMMMKMLASAVLQKLVNEQVNNLKTALAG